ncbi:hypothetical protein BH11VER1_BH11VER1_00640 [soil metagenome]
MYPEPLNDLIDLFEHLPEQERRENLVVMADNSKRYEPLEGEVFDLEDVRKDEECTDTVGVFLRVDEDDKLHFAVTLGPLVQTLTKAMTSILCRGLNGAKPQEVLDIPADFVPRIIGSELVRLRSQTVYYVLSRMKTATKMYLDRRRAIA